ncbi:MAG: CDP-glycerol--glycerophosphate glycerophosphotransferase [Desulfuromonas sp.]|nr:MAG: CDP-glycerol--glycerophosphate glycerophosphotransferase [Desulfuromonas sp.]
MYVSELYALGILRPMQKAARARGAEVAWFFEKDGAEHLTENERLLSSVEEVLAYKPDAVFVPGNWVPHFFPGIKVQVNHGFIANKFSDSKGHFRIRGFFDLYVTQGADTTGPFNELAKKHGYFEVVETGWPKMDPMYWQRDDIPQYDRPVVMLGSTFTPRMSCAMPLLETITRLSKTGKWQWLINLHPKMAPEVVASYKAIQGEYLDFPDTDDIVPLLRAADVMVCDTSSILSEFMLQQKPVVTFRNQAPGPHMIDIDDPEKLEASIEYALTQPPEIMEEIRKYTDLIHPYHDGRSSERVLDAADGLIERGLGHLKKKPLNLLRKYKVCKRLGYFSL